jgi:hypothetical protein
MRARMRQLTYPKEFRVPEIPWPEEPDEVLTGLATAVSALEQKREGDGFELPGDFLAVLGTNLWRLRSKMLKPGTSEPLDEMRVAHYYLESLWQAFRDAGGEIVDETGRPFVSGTSVKVISFEPLEGIERPVVTETMRPTIYFRDRRIQKGEIIVGTPSSEAAAAPTDMDT